MEERRRYFRIDDEVSLAYRVLSDVEANRGPESNVFAEHFDNRIASLLSACKIESPIAAEILGLLNQKVNLLAQQLNAEDALLQQLKFNQRQVNISACGLSMVLDEAIAVGSKIKLELQLQNSEFTIPIIARVLACEASGTDWFARLDFEQVRPHDQELLIQYIVKRQSTKLKAQRGLPD